MDSTTLFLSVIFGAIGTGYFVYGKRQERIVALVCGILLIAFPYFIDSTWISICLGIALMIVPFLYRV